MCSRSKVTWKSFVAWKLRLHRIIDRVFETMKERHARPLATGWFSSIPSG